MYARPAADLADTPRGREAQALLSRCVHCGFCLPACPTYRVTGNELDSPRGRIYLVKQLVEGSPAGATTQAHLDRCLTCRACESACPSGVEYGRIVDLGRELAQERIRRPLRQRVLRYAATELLSRRRVFAALAYSGDLVRSLLPDALRRKLPPSDTGALAARSVAHGPGGAAPAAGTETTSGPQGARRRVVLLDGCVQPTLAPGINAATERVLARIGLSVVRAPREACCGALCQHLDRPGKALDQARRNVEACDALLSAGADAVVSTASACGLMIKDYQRLLGDDARLAAAARRVSSATRDLCELIEPVDLERAGLAPGAGRTVAWQAPCTLQHGQRITGRIEALLVAAGYRLAPAHDAALCCGSAGTYSILQPEMSAELRRRKLEALTLGRPVAIATANIGCLAHLREASPVPVRHWIELVDAAPNR